MSASMYRWMPALALVIALGACDDPTDPIPLYVPTVTLEAVGDAAQLTATNAGDDLPHWESLDPSVVTVTPAGMAVAVSAGTATVRATLGSRTAEGTITVLPPVDVIVYDLEVVTEAGQTGMGMRVKNEGGRGYFRMEFWREKTGAETEHKRIIHYLTDLEASVGMDISHQNFLSDETADWVIVYSREPMATHYTLTSCVRLDGATPCPMP